MQMVAVLGFVVLLAGVVTLALPGATKQKRIKYFKEKLEQKMMQNEVAKEMQLPPKPLVKPVTSNTDSSHSGNKNELTEYFIFTPHIVPVIHS